MECASAKQIARCGSDRMTIDESKIAPFRQFCHRLSGSSSNCVVVLFYFSKSTFVWIQAALIGAPFRINSDRSTKFKVGLRA